MYQFIISLAALYFHSCSVQAVSVVLRSGMATPETQYFTAICNDIAPGQCCRPPPRPPGWTWFSEVNYFREARWTGLEYLDVAAVWRPYGDWEPHDDEPQRNGCSGVAIATKPGPGSWTYSQRGVTGASYLRIPQTVPEDGAKMGWLDAQGILGLVTGGKKWASPRASSSLSSRVVDEFQRLSELRWRRRGIIGGYSGTVFAQRPGSYVWPDRIILNGTEYVEQHPGSPIYMTAGGLVLNMTS